jgi:hypothetical protein
MLRALVLALLLANLAFFGWTQGWLDSVLGARSTGDREPERLARQVRPEAVRILSAGAGAGEPAAAAALACLEAGPFAENEAAAAQAAARGVLPTGGWVMARVEQPGSWLVYMGKYPNREALSKKEEELKRRKLSYELVEDNAALTPGVSLGRYEERALAAKALEQFAKQGIQTARVVELAPASTRQWLRVEKADAAVAAKLSALTAEALGKGFVPCATPPPGN